MTIREREAVRAWVRRTRQKQGLPATVQDPALLAKLAADVLALERRGGGGDAP